VGDYADAEVAHLSDPDMGGLGDPYYRRPSGALMPPDEPPVWDLPDDTQATVAEDDPFRIEPANTARDIAQKIAQKYSGRGEELLAQHGHTKCAQLKRVQYLPADAKYPETARCGCKLLVTEGEPLGVQDVTDLVPAMTNGEAAAEGRKTYHPDDPIAATIALIDPTKVYTPEEIERQILDCNARLERGAHFERAALEEEGRTELLWSNAFDLAVLNSEQRAVDLRKADAMVSTRELHDAFVTARMVRKAIQSTMHNLRSVLSGYQSVGKSIANTYGAANTQHR
jgi:hypothetical protein